MNDFSELEAELKKLRPAAASPELSARIERGLAEVSGRTATAGVLPKPRNIRVNWFALGLGLAAAAALLLLARIDVDQPAGKRQSVVATTPLPFAQPVPNDAFVPAGLTQVVYDTRDEGLHFPESGDQPVRRVRSRKRETLKWNNPQTGTSLRVSYPSEEVTLIPVEGQ
jgi:hypothetical protein